MYFGKMRRSQSLRIKARFVP
ncbi:unnamed protein product, partial [Vitis vinifera]